MGNACMCVQGGTVHVSNRKAYEARAERYISSRSISMAENSTGEVSSSNLNLYERSNSFFGEKRRALPVQASANLENHPMSTPIKNNGATVRLTHKSYDNNDTIIIFNNNTELNNLFQQQRQQQQVSHQKPRFSYVREGRSSVSIVEKLAPYCSTFLLENIRDKIETGATSATSPNVYFREGVILVIDITGFTEMCAKLDKMADGAEYMMKYVNSYFTLLVDEVLSHGGDVDKWSGDAMLCMWYGPESLPTLITRAVQCAIEVQNRYGHHKAGDVVLNVHCAIAAGPLSTFDIGGYENEWLRFTHGNCLFELDTAIDAAKSGDVVISKVTYLSNGLHDIISASQTSSGDFLVKSVTRPVIKIQKETVVLSNAFEPFLRSFVDRTVQKRIDNNQERFLSEIKYVTIVFISMLNQKIYESDLEKMRQYNAAMNRVQQIVAEVDGYISNFLRDEKAGVLVITFGHPISYTNDAHRAIICASKLREMLLKQQLALGVGISSGRSSFGRVGSDTRSDFTVMSDTANTAARLMKLSQSQLGVIIVDEKTASRCEEVVEFEEMESVTLKGKNEKLRVRKVKGDVVNGAPEIGRRTQQASSEGHEKSNETR